LLEWKEEHPLGKAEWIKVYGIAFGCYDLAQQKFDEIEKSYQKTESLIQKITVSKPTILVGSMFQDIWYLPGGNSYMAKVIRDAQGDYVLKNDRTIGSQSFGFEQIYKKYAHSKKWINVGVGTKKELVSLYANYRYFDAFQTGQMYSYQKNFLKYFEESPVKPHLALLDLHKIFTEDNPTHLYFYSKLD
jgi:iron complex transport system substrate-binding protein